MSEDLQKAQERLVEAKRERRQAKLAFKAAGEGPGEKREAKQKLSAAKEAVTRCEEAVRALGGEVPQKKKKAETVEDDDED